MPLYEYVCESCGFYLETMQSFSDPPVAVCGWCEGRMKKLVSAPAFQFKGSGWYVSDYARAGSKSGDKPASPGAAESSAPASSDATAAESGNAKAEKKESPASPAPAAAKAD